MIESDSRSPWRLRDLISTPSIVMLPTPSTSTRRNKVRSRDDLPLPVLPTTPRVVPAGISTETLRRTRGDDGVYLMDTF